MKKTWKKCFVTLETATGTKLLCNDSFLRSHAPWGNKKTEIKMFKTRGWAERAIREVRKMVNCSQWHIFFVYENDVVHADGYIERN
jgi:hypothetical protein